MDAEQVWIRSTPIRPESWLGGRVCLQASQGTRRRSPLAGPRSRRQLRRPAPPRPALPGSHTLTCVTDPGREGWRTGREEGARARARPLLAASLSSSLATGRRPSPAGGALIGEKRTSERGGQSDSAGLPRLLFSSPCSTSTHLSPPPSLPPPGARQCP